MSGIWKTTMAKIKKWIEQLEDQQQAIAKKHAKAIGVKINANVIPQGAWVGNGFNINAGHYQVPACGVFVGNQAFNVHWGDYAAPELIPFELQPAPEKEMHPIPTPKEGRLYRVINTEERVPKKKSRTFIFYVDSLQMWTDGKEMMQAEAGVEQGLDNVTIAPGQIGTWSYEIKEQYD